MESDQLKLLARGVQPIDTIVADAGATGLKIFVENEAAIPSVASVLQGAAETVRNIPGGPIWFCLMDDRLPGEVEIDSGAEFPVTPAIKGAIKSLGGVMAVEEI